MPLDTNVFDKIKTFSDYQKADQDFQMRKALATQQLQSGGIDAATKANIYATQVLSAATATGDQNAYDQAKQTLQGQGIDTSTWAPDVKSGAQQAQAARLAQSPLGSLLSAGTKIDANNIAAAGVTGQINGGSQFGLPAAGISAILGGGAPAANMNPNLPRLVQAESGGNPNAVSPAGAAGAFQIMPATATNPGYGVKPLQGWDGIDPRTASQEEQQRFANDYLNAMQANNGGNPQLGAAAYNAGPGRVQQALNALPAETQAYVGKVAPFQPPPQNSNETLPAYKDRVQQAFEAYKADPAYVTAQAAASETGKAQADAAKSAVGAGANFDQVVQTINGIKALNNSPAGLPQDRGFVPAGAKAYLAQNIGDTRIGNALGVPSQALADNYNAFTKENEAQTIGAIKELASTGQIRMTRTLENILNRGYLIEPGSSTPSKNQQADIILAELNNSKIAAQNVNSGLNNGQATPYQTMPTANAPQGAVSNGIKFLGFK